MGAGHRLQLAKSPIFNIHAGITIGTIQGTIYFNDDFMNPYSTAPYIEFESSSELKSRAFFSAYLGLSKDIHLTNRFILSLSYRKQIGLTGGSVHHFDYTTNAFAGSYRATGTLNGSESSFLVGLKFKLSDK